MSTRCQILVEGASASVYRHSDGYPDGPHGVIKSLKKIVKNFMTYRGFDPEYMTAHIVSEMIVVNKRNCSKSAHMMPSNAKGYEELKYTGFGVQGYIEHEDNFNGDIEYVYVVKENRTIEVRQPTGKYHTSGFSMKDTAVTSVVKF